MIQTIAFRNGSGHLGFIQKDGNFINYYVNTDQELYSVSGANSWHSWIQQVEAGYLKGDKELLSVESIKFFLNNHAETISIEIIEAAEVVRPGSYYPRIDRENIYFNYVDEQFLQDVRAYQNIQASLDQLFNYIEPAIANLPAYGHKIRELLILSCTEVECLMVKCLIENGYEQKDRYSTNDYVKCKDLLGLERFEVKLIRYPTVKPFKPFQGWKSDSPTKTLIWYNAYNSVKHNRSDNITDANLEHLLDAMSAIHILLESQYGKSIFERWSGRTEDRSIFTTTVRPKWPCNEVTAPIFTAGFDFNATWSDKRQYFIDHRA